MARRELYVSVNVESDGPIPGGNGQMPAALLSRRPHPHNALDDAIEQAELFYNLVGWTGTGT